MLLIHDQVVQLDKRHLGWHGVESVPHQRVGQKLDQERFVFRIDRDRVDDRVVRAAGFFFFEDVNMILRRLPFLNESRFVLRVDRLVPNEAEKASHGWTPR